MLSGAAGQRFGCFSREERPGALLRRPFDHAQVELFEVGFRAPRKSQFGMPCLRRRSNTCRAGLVRPSVHQALLNALDCFDSIEQHLVGRRFPDAVRSAVKWFLDEYRSPLRPFEAEHEVAPGVLVRRTGGHTPGHSMVRLTSGSDRLTFAGDAVFAVGFDQPEWAGIGDGGR